MTHPHIMQKKTFLYFLEELDHFKPIFKTFFILLPSQKKNMDWA